MCNLYSHKYVLFLLVTSYFMKITVNIFFNVISLCTILEKKLDSEREQETVVPEEDLFMHTFVLVKLLASRCFYATCVLPNICAWNYVLILCVLSFVLVKLLA